MVSGLTMLKYFFMDCNLDNFISAHKFLEFMDHQPTFSFPVATFILR